MRVGHGCALDGDRGFTLPWDRIGHSGSAVGRSLLVACRKLFRLCEGKRRRIPGPWNDRSPPCNGRSRRRGRHGGASRSRSACAAGRTTCRTLILTAEDSGTTSAPVVFQAYRDEQAVISGGVRLEEPEVGAAAGRDQEGRSPGRARHGPAFRQRSAAADGALSQLRSRSADLQRLRRGRLQPRAGARDGRTRAAASSMPCTPANGAVSTTSSPARRRTEPITFEGGWQNNRPAAMHDQFRFVENIFEELDAPGEWFLDAKTHTLYYLPAGRRRPGHGDHRRRSACDTSSSSAAPGRPRCGSSPSRG